MKELLPEPVFQAIAGYLRQAAAGARSNWEVNAANEDSLSGVVFRGLHTPRTRKILVNGHVWRWRIRSRKLGSGGERSEEKMTGADGIVEVEIRHPDGRVEFKGMLVQAKKQWTGRDSDLLRQVGDMEALRNGISAALDIAPNGYVAVDGRAVISAESDRREVAPGSAAPMGTYLAERFLPCLVGLRGVHYDAHRRILYLPPSPGLPDAVRLPISSRLRIEIEES